MMSLYSFEHQVELAAMLELMIVTGELKSDKTTDEKVKNKELRLLNLPLIACKRGFSPDSIAASSRVRANISF